MAVLFAVFDYLALDSRAAGSLVTRLARLPAVRAVVRFDSASLSREAADFSGIVAALPGSGGVVVSVERARLSPQYTAALEGVLLRGPRRTLLSTARLNLKYAGGSVTGQSETIALGADPVLAALERVEFQAAAGAAIEIPKASAAGLRIPGDALQVDAVSVSQVKIPRDRHPQITVPLVVVGASTAQLVRSRDGSWNLPAPADVQAVAADLRAAYAAVIASYDGFAPRLRQWLFWTVVLVTAVIAVLKFALTAGALAWRSISAAAPVGLAYVLYFVGLRSWLGLALAGAAIAAALSFAIYRKAPEWHQRWEPLVVDLFAPLAIVFSLAAYAFVLPPVPGEPARVVVEHVRTGRTNATVRAEGVGEAVVKVAESAVSGVSLDLAGPSVRIDRVRVTGTGLDVAPAVVRARIPEFVAERIAAGPGEVPSALVQARGVTDSPMLASVLGRIRYLPDALRRPAPFGFCVNWQAGAQLPAACEGPEQLLVRGSSTVSGAGQVRYALESAIRGAGAGVVLTAEGEGPRVRVTSIRSQPASSVAIAGGAGVVELGRNARAQLELRGISRPGFATETLTFRADASAARRLALSAEARKVKASLASLETAALEFESTTAVAGTNIRAVTEIRDLRFSGPQWLDAALPWARTQVSGVYGRDGFEGTVALASPAAELGGIRFAISPLAGTLRFPPQEFRLKQAAVDFLPGCCSGRLSSDTRIGALSPFKIDVRANLDLDPQRVMLLPLETTLKSLRLAWNGVSQVGFDSTWSVGEAAIPQAFELREISALKLKSSGSLAGLQFDSNLLPSWNLPELPREFRISGTAGGPVSIATAQGAFEIGQTTPVFRKVVFRDGRLQEATFLADVGGFRTSRGQSDFFVKAVVAAAGWPARLSVSGAAPGAESWTIDADPNRLHVMAHDMFLDRLWEGTAPLREEFGWRLDGLHPMARLRGLDASMAFSQARLASADVRVEVAPGALGRVDLKPPGQTAQARAQAPLDAQLSISPAEGEALRLVSKLNAPAASFSLDAGSGNAQAAFGVEAEARGALRFSQTAPTQLAGRIASTIAGLRPHFIAASDVFGSNEAPRLDWNLEIGNSQAGDPFLVAGADRWSVKLEAPLLDVSSGTARVRGSSRVAADLVSHADAVILDARVPARLDYSTSRGPSRALRLDLPILVAFARAFPDRLPDGDTLWSPSEIARVWDGFVVRNANRGPAGVFDPPELRIGNFLIAPARIPAAPVPLTIEYAGPLRINVPVSGDLLFGKLAGIAQAEIAWRDNAACVTSRFQSSLTGLQADALGLELQGMTSPLIADEWNAGVSFRSDGVCFNRVRLAALARDPLSFDLFTGTRLRLDVTRAPSAAPDGYLQLTTIADLRHLDKTLRDILASIRMKTLPQVVRFREFSLALETDGERVLARGPIVRLGGLSFFTSNQLAVGGDLRLHLRPSAGKDVTVRDLIELLRSVQ